MAYIPAFLEDRSTFMKEVHNGLYGPVAFLLSNTVVGLPFLPSISVTLSSFAYWMSNFWLTAKGFLMFIMGLFIDLIAAESLVVLISSIVSIFVGALALTAFANGLWMSIGGFLVEPKILNFFWVRIFTPKQNAALLRIIQ